MPFNINEFSADVQQRGYVKTNLFEVWVSAPVPGFNTNLSRHMTNRIDQVRIPGISFQNLDVSRYGVGPTQKQPYNAQFNEISFNLICDQYGDSWQFWHDWLRYIYDFTPYAAPGEGNIFSQANYSMNYKDEYSGVMSIVMYGMDGLAVKRIDMFNAFPTSIKEMPVSWEDQNNLLKLNISVTFKEYTVVAAR